MQRPGATRQTNPLYKYGVSVSESGDVQFVYNTPDPHFVKLFSQDLSQQLSRVTSIHLGHSDALNDIKYAGGAIATFRHMLSKKIIIV